MPEENVFIMDGIKTQWDADTMVVSELGYDRTAMLDNNGNILSSTFGKDGDPFLHHWFDKMKPMIDDFRAIDREYADA
ncbi:hypothetical protein [Bifidobacterium avesanii]|uniref:Uncharacterized protein n=1 Tax=Bifidobacterium avesanii TaxID=1798157 RepID=A0A7K3THJ1_9BIFI|nr:hypothetical protein [Bifidobacterium avesanii]KAB8287720.1 hypothetical protein DSM100685_1862 [Bifidobacterium avesanii]NEG78179.1 hypothetical protein [Bifidobacterium avesanii]